MFKISRSVYYLDGTPRNLCSKHVQQSSSTILIFV